MGNNGINREQVLRAGDQRERAKLLNTSGAEEIIATLSPEAILRLGTYQLRMFNWPGSRIEHLIARPLTATLSHDNPNDTHLLTHNTAMYDDDTEDMLYEDPIIAALAVQTRNHPNDEWVRDALRARRTILVAIEHIASVTLAEQVSMPTEPLSVPTVVVSEAA